MVGDQRAEHSSGLKVSHRARDSTLVRCANMLCEKFFISGFIASTWGYDLPLPGVISPPLLAPDGCLKANSSALQTYLNFCVIEQCPSLLSFDLKENSLAETRLLPDEFLFRGACKKRGTTLTREFLAFLLLTKEIFHRYLISGGGAPEADRD